MTTNESALTEAEQAAFNRFMDDLRQRVEGYESAEAFEITSREDFESILKKLPDRMIVLACFGELD